MAKKKCVKGWGCGNSCISRLRRCKSNLNDEGKKLVETFTQFIQRTQEPGDLADEPKPKKKGGKIENPDLVISEPKTFDGGKKPWGQTELYKANSEKRRQRIIEELDGNEELYNQINQEISKIFEEDGYEPVVYIKASTLNTIAEQPKEEQRLKNQFETGTSEGALNQFLRREAEDPVLGFDSGFTYDNFKATDEVIVDPEDGTTQGGPDDPLVGRERPIYTGFQKVSDGYKMDYDQYGGVAFKIKGLKPSDYTITGNDSLNSFGMGPAWNADDRLSAKTREGFDITAMNTSVLDRPGGLKEFIKNSGLFGDDITGNPRAIAEALIENSWDEGYLEAQIMTDVTPDMMEIVENKSSFSLTPEAKALFNLDDSDTVKTGKGLGLPDGTDPVIVSKKSLEEHKKKLDLLAEKALAMFKPIGDSSAAEDDS